MLLADGHEQRQSKYASVIKIAQAKKLGVFVNFRDFKGATGEALVKMITDLRKFGLNVAKNLRPEHLHQGHGEVVCHLIDELLNVELFRREY